MGDIEGTNGDYFRWDDPQLYAGIRETAWQRSLRVHQSWYRERILQEPPGSFRKRTRPNWLTEEGVARNPTLNFLKRPEILSVVNERLRRDREWGGLVNEDRVKRNLLSSQPLAFNLFGYLSFHLDSAATLLRTVLPINVERVKQIRLEYSPFALRKEEWRSGSAFDAFVLYETSTGKRGFLGIECKYHEDLTRQNNRPGLAAESIYRVLTAESPSHFLPGSEDALNARATCQLWYNSCLVLKALQLREGWNEGHLVLMGCSGDSGASKAFDSFTSCLTNRDWAHSVSYESLMQIAEGDAELIGWARDFKVRYLNLKNSPAP